MKKQLLKYWIFTQIGVDANIVIFIVIVLGVNGPETSFSAVYG